MSVAAATLSTCCKTLATNAKERTIKINLRLGLGIMESAAGAVVPLF